jgi:hypothetical protein
VANPIPLVEIVLDETAVLRVTTRKGDTSNQVFLTVNRGTVIKASKRQPPRLALSGPSSGVVGVPAPFTVTGSNLVANVTVTPSMVPGSASAPFVLTPTVPSATFTATPSQAGSATVSITNSAGITNPPSLTYTATAAAPPPPPIGASTLEVSFPQPATIGAGGSGGFSLAMSGGPVAPVALLSGVGTSMLTYSLTRTVQPAETGTLAYAQPGNGIKTAGGDVPSFGPTPVANVVIGAPPPPPPPPPPPDGPSWLTVPSISFAQGVASTHDLTQYTTGFSAALHEMRVAEGVVLPTGVALNPTGSLLYDGAAPVASVSGVALDIEDRTQELPSGSQQDTILQTWDQRISQPCVVRHFSFADPAHLGEGPGGYGYGYNYGWYGGFDDNLGTAATDHPVIDTSVHPATSGGSMRVTMDSTRSGGLWTCNFSDDLQTRFNLGDEFFVQWRQRFNAAMLGPNVDQYGPWKQCLVSTGDTAYTVGGVAGSCQEIEMCVESYAMSLTLPSGTPIQFPTAYVRCPSEGGTLNLTESHPTEFLLLQNMRPAPYCSYNNMVGAEGIAPPGGNCFVYVADEWMTFQVGITIGPTRVGNDVANSRFRLWGQREGQPSVPLIDITRTMTFYPDSPGYGKFWITTRNPQARNTTMQTWYSELIISTQRIPDAL